MLADAGSGHPGGSLSAVEILTALYFEKMRLNGLHSPDRDRFVLSKGHAAPAYYACWARMVFSAKESLRTCASSTVFLQGHPDCKKCPGVDVPPVLWGRASLLPLAWP